MRASHLAKESDEDRPFEVRRSPVHGLGAFATRFIRKGERLTEYLGERVSHEEADRRYEGKDANDNHTFLFTVDSKTVIDAGVGGNDARYFNHSCAPNCESVIENRRVFIDAIRDIEPGEELTYDYQIGREPDDPPNIDEIFACRCGAPQCRGTMLWPPKKAKKRKAPAKSAARRARGKSSAKSGSTRGRAKTRAKGKAVAKKSGGARGASGAQGRGGRKSRSVAKSRGQRARSYGQGRRYGQAKRQGGAQRKGRAQSRVRAPIRAKGKAVARAPGRSKGRANRTGASRGRTGARARSKR